MELKEVKADWQGFCDNILMRSRPGRVFLFEHGIDETIIEKLTVRYSLADDLDINDTAYDWRRALAVHKFLGIELIRVFPPGGRFEIQTRSGSWVEESSGAVTNEQEFENFKWPDPNNADLSVLDFYETFLPEDFRVFVVLDVWEKVRDLIGFETLCYKIYDDPDFVKAVFEKVGNFALAVAEMCCDYDCFGTLYIADDLGYKTSTMLAEDTIRDLVIPWHKKLADIAHRKSKLVFFHSCGQMYSLMDDYIDHVRIHAKHSFEEVVKPVTQAKKQYGGRVALLGGMDVDFLSRADSDSIREKTRQVLTECTQGGGYCLGSGNWVTSYIPLDNYLAMLDEGRRFS